MKTELRTFTTWCMIINLVMIRVIVDDELSLLFNILVYYLVKTPLNP